MKTIHVPTIYVQSAQSWEKHSFIILNIFVPAQTADTKSSDSIRVAGSLLYLNQDCLCSGLGLLCFVLQANNFKSCL